MFSNGGDGCVGKTEIINLSIMKQRNVMMLQSYK